MSKYNNVRCEVDGERFDSIKEASRWKDLLLLQRAGEIKDLRRQVQYELVPPHGKNRGVYYVADFVYLERPKGWEKIQAAGQYVDWVGVVEDVKGVRTREYGIKKKLMFHVHGILIREV